VTKTLIQIDKEMYISLSDITSVGVNDITGAVEITVKTLDYSIQVLDFTLEAVVYYLKKNGVEFIKMPVTVKKKEESKNDKKEKN